MDTSGTGGEVKTCIKCREAKLRIGFYKDDRARDGLNGRCKVCCKVSSAAYYVSNRETIKATTRKWEADNHSKLKPRRAIWRAVNREKANATGAEWKNANQRKVKASDAAYRAANPGKIKSANAKHRAANPWRYSAKCAQRRAQKLQATPGWANKEKIEEFYYTARMLGMHTGGAYHVDHIVPLQSAIVCGLHVEANLEVQTAKHNRRKGNRYWPDMAAKHLSASGPGRDGSRPKPAQLPAGGGDIPVKLAVKHRQPAALAPLRACAGNYSLIHSDRIEILCGGAY